MNSYVLRAAAFMVALVNFTSLFGQTDTTFTYQGELRQAGELASGAYAMEFSLWDAPSDGSQVGSSNVLPIVPVSEGIFSVELDFGAAAFNNASRWLQVSVEGVELGPRTFLSRTPYAIQTRGIFVAEDQSVGVGTTSPQARLHVDGQVALGFGQADMRIQEINPADPRFSDLIDFFGIGIGSDTGTNRQMMMLTDGFPSNPIFTVTSSIDGGTNWNAHLVVRQDGKVGINTTAPAFTLHVEGDAGKPGGGSWSTTSDLRAKRNVESLHGALSSLLSLRGVTFEYVDPYRIDELPGRHMGMIAQEVEAVYPEWVGMGPQGYKTLTFRGFEALTVEAMRELYLETRRELAAKEAALRDVTQRVEALEALVANRAEKSRSR